MILKKTLKPDVSKAGSEDVKGLLAVSRQRSPKQQRKLFICETPDVFCGLNDDRR